MASGRSSASRQAAWPPGRPGTYAVDMHAVQFTDEELRIVREALHAYLDDFGHEEADILQLLKAILAKLPEPG